MGLNLQNLMMMVVVLRSSVTMFCVGFVEDSKIVGGQRAELVPFIVSVQRNEGHYCGGSLLSLSTALTACHCVGELKPVQPGNNSYSVLHPFTPESFVLQAGDWVLYISNSHSQRRNARFFYVHPRCAKIEGVLEFDFSIITVQSAFTETDFVKPTHMLFNDKTAYRKRLLEFIDNEKHTCWVLGWGKSDVYQGHATTRFLKKAKMRFISDFHCQDLLGRHNPVFSFYDFNSKAQVCAVGVRWTDSDCTGDSGGPVWCRDHIMAIVSYGLPECGRGDEPAVYAKLEDFVEWYNTESENIIHRGSGATFAAIDRTMHAIILVFCLKIPTISN